MGVLRVNHVERFLDAVEYAKTGVRKVGTLAQPFGET